MPKPTQYLADFELTTLVRRVTYPDSTQGWEPLWLQSGDSRGLAVFVSALDAEIYRQQAQVGGSLGWQRLPLARFDLLEHIKNLDGRLYCQMVFGFGASMSGELAIRNGKPRVHLVPLPFELATDTQPPITFYFDAWVFNFMREQWALLSAPDYATQVERMNEATDTELAATATHALRAVAHFNSTGEDPDWGVYAPEIGIWRFGPDELRQKTNLH